jgi:hypothetical protein
MSRAAWAEGLANAEAGRRLAAAFGDAASESRSAARSSINF